MLTPWWPALLKQNIFQKYIFSKFEVENRERGSLAASRGSFKPITPFCFMRETLMVEDLIQDEVWFGIKNWSLLFFANEMLNMFFVVMVVQSS